MTYKDFLNVCGRRWSDFNIEMNKGRLVVDWQAENFFLIRNYKYLILFREWRGELRPHIVKVEDILNAELSSVDLDERTVYMDRVFSRMMVKTYAFTDGTNQFNFTYEEGFNYSVYTKGEEIWYKRIRDVDILEAIQDAMTARPVKRDD